MVTIVLQGFDVSETAADVVANQILAGNKTCGRDLGATVRIGIGGAPMIYRK